MSLLARLCWKSVRASLRHGGFRREVDLVEKAFAKGALFGRALLWVAACAMIAAETTMIVSFWLIDFVHGNPGRTQLESLETILIFTPIFAIVAVVGVFLVFGASQLLQAMALGAFVRRFRVRLEIAALLTLPVAALLTWYSYDYLTPHFEPDVPADDWQPYHHGITAWRYLAALGAQSLVSLFTVLYVSTSARPRLRRRLIVTALLAGVVVGGIMGRSMAVAQYQYL